MATDSSGGTTFTSVALNASGYPEHNSAIVIPFVDRDYKIALYPTQADADADSNAIFTIDGLTPVSVSGNFTIDDSVVSGVTNVITMVHTVDGTPGVGIGTGLAFVTETADGNNETGMVIESVSTDVGSGTEAFNMHVKLMKAGSPAADVYTVDSDGNLTGLGDLISTLTLKPLGDTSAGDLAALGYNSVDGAVITGQGSSFDVALKNDAAANVLTIPTGTTNVDIVGDVGALTVTADGAVSAGDLATMGYSAVNGLELTGQGSTNDWNLLNDTAVSVIRCPTGTVAPVFAGVADFSAAGLRFNDEALTEYDEGTFTPILTDLTNNATSGGATYGRYTRIGNVVWINIRMITTSLGSVTGSISISGLPFTPDGTADCMIHSGQAAGLNIASSVSVTGYVESATRMVLALWDATTGTTQMQGTEWSDDGDVYFSGWYEI